MTINWNYGIMTLRVENLSKKYADKLLFHNISFRCCLNQVVGIFGENGCGKTTLIKTLCGLTIPDEGDIFIKGLDLRQRRCHLMRSIGVAFGGSKGLYWKLAAWQNYVYFAGLRGDFGRLVKERGEYLFHLLNLWPMRNALVETYSSGMRQKLAILCALAHNPDIVFLDEPMTNLDPRSTELVLGLIQKLASEGKLVILTGHAVQPFSAICDQVFYIVNPNLENVCVSKMPSERVEKGTAYSLEL